nr:ROK family transcriptional regulator [Sagittula salina]
MTLVRQMGPLAKAEIARLTGLSAQTVSVIMRGLEADGLLKKGAPVRGKVGQPSVPMSIARDGAFFLGLKVGRRSLDLILTDFHGNVKGRRHMVHRYPNPDGVVDFANRSIAELIASLPKTQRARVAGLGIAIPFRLHDWAGPLGVAPEDMAAWKGRDIAPEIAEGWDFPVYLRNDASAACGAELVFGDQNRPRDFLYFFIGFFVGGGMVLDNTLYTGRTGNAAALGSLPILADGRVRQLVDVASLISLEQLAAAQGGATEMIWDDPSSWQIDPDVLEPWLQRAVAGLAQAILSAACIVDFDTVMIDGWLPPEVRAEIVARVQRQLQEDGLPGIEVPQVRAGTIGPDARALGAASLPLSDRFLVDRTAFLKG